MSVRLGMVVYCKLKIARFKTARMKHGEREAGKSRNATVGNRVNLSFVQGVASFVLMALSDRLSPLGERVRVRVCGVRWCPTCPLTPALSPDGGEGEMRPGQPSPQKSKRCRAALATAIQDRWRRDPREQPPPDRRYKQAHDRAEDDPLDLDAGHFDAAGRVEDVSRAQQRQRPYADEDR